MALAAVEDEEAAAGADVHQTHLLPVAVDVHLVGEPDLHRVGQRLAAGRVQRFGRRVGLRGQALDLHIGGAELGFGAEVDVDLAVPVE